MHLTRKTLYALRAVHELARRQAGEPVPAADIARAQGVPVRFLETILHELRQAGFVTSRRGSRGGYQLARRPGALTVSEVMAFTQGPGGVTGADDGEAPHPSGDPFRPLWRQVSEAVAGVLDATTFRDVLNWEEERAAREAPLSYVI